MYYYLNILKHVFEISDNMLHKRVFIVNNIIIMNKKYITDKKDYRNMQNIMSKTIVQKAKK